ncbi:MAG: hypothetical protein RLZZ22_1082 [Pseudomonadota bacterium]|jgi:hypothetical protein
MNEATTPLIENSPAASDPDTQLRLALLALLTPLAAQQVTAREAYSAMTRLVARLEGDVPTGARLVGLLQLFNAQRPAGVPAIPVGTAGVAQDCMAAYRRSLVRANTLGVAHPALPADMIEGLNRWLERLLDLMKDEIRRPYEAEAVQLRAQLAAELASQQQAAEAERQSAREALRALESRLEQNQQQTMTLEQENAAQALRLGELQAALVRSGAENRASAERAAVLQSRLEQSADRLGQLELSLRQTQAAGDEERRQRLLSIDAARVIERELAGEREKRKAADALARTLEKYLEEEKSRAVALQSALSEAQRQPVLVAAELAKPSQSRLKPSRRSAPAAAPVRRKRLR